MSLDGKAVRKPFAAWLRGKIEYHRGGFSAEDARQAEAVLAALPHAQPIGEPGRIPELEPTRANAEYWVAAARNADTDASALLGMEQAVNAWKNAAYAAWDKINASCAPSHVVQNPLLSHECGKNMTCSICGSLPIASAFGPDGRGVATGTTLSTTPRTDLTLPEKKLAYDTASRYFSMQGKYSGPDAHEQCRLAIVEALKAVCSPSATPRISPLRTCEHGVVYGDLCRLCTARADESDWHQLYQHEFDRRENVERLPADILALCKLRGWNLHWTHRGAYLHLESSELIEALRGKRGDPLREAADVLLVLMSITENAGLPWAEVLKQARATCEELKTRPRYRGEEFSAADGGKQT